MRMREASVAAVRPGIRRATSREPGVRADAAPRAGLDSTAALVIAVCIGVAVRAYHVLTADFPLNDGGLFLQMTRDLQRAHYLLPAWTTYNHATIPFGYSPLGFYLAGLLSDATGLSLFQIFRWLPLLVSCLTIGAFFLLARRLLVSRAAAVVAVAAFGLLPRSFIWMVMGGGVTRALGFCFALLTLERLHRLYAARNLRAVPLAALFGGLTLLSHLGTAMFVVASALLLLLAAGRHRTAIVGTVLAGLGALAIAAPWWGRVIALHGLAPFRAAGATGGWVFGSMHWRDLIDTLARSGLGTGEPVLAPIGMLAAIGFFYTLAGEAWLLPVWWLVITLFDTRQGATFSTVPIAMLVGVALVDVFLPAIRRRSGLRVETAADAAGAAPAAPGGQWRAALWRHYPALVLGGFVLFAFASALMRPPDTAGALGDLGVLGPGERAAMAWVARRTPPDARLLVVTDAPWQTDRAAEWLPVLGERVSVATVQGTEWLPSHLFRRREAESRALQHCADRDTACLEHWARTSGLDFTHVYVPQPMSGACCGALVASLENDTRYRRVFVGPGALIFARRSTRREATPRPASDTLLAQGM